MDKITEKEEIICWSKLCMKRSGWGSFIVGAFAFALFALPILYYAA